MAANQPFHPSDRGSAAAFSIDSDADEFMHSGKEGLWIDRFVHEHLRLDEPLLSHALDGLSQGFPQAVIRTFEGIVILAVEILQDAGYPTERSSDEAWPAFEEWRRQYGAMASQLLNVVVAPRARWSGPRSLPARHRSRE